MSFILSYIAIGIAVMLADILIDWNGWRRLVRMDGIIATTIVGIVVYSTFWPLYLLTMIMFVVTNEWKKIFRGKASK